MQNFGRKNCVDENVLPPEQSSEPIRELPLKIRTKKKDVRLQMCACPEKEFEGFQRKVRGRVNNINIDEFFVGGECRQTHGGGTNPLVEQLALMVALA